MSKGRIAIIGGTGDLGFGLALRLAKARERIIIGSRDKPKAEDASRRLKEILGEDVTVEGLENADAAARAEVVILSIPLHAQGKILEGIASGLDEGDIVVDTTVPLETYIGGRPTRTIDLWRGSAAERVVDLVPKGVRVVSAFHTVSAMELQLIEREIDCDIIVCGDDEHAKHVVMGLAEKIPGARAIDGGKLEYSRIVEKLAALLININLRYGIDHAGIRITGIPIK